MRISLFLLSVLLFLQVKGQTAVFPSNGTLYDGKLHRIDLLMDPDSLSALLAIENRWTNHSYPATFVYDGKDTLHNVGVRMKGNTSRNSQKLSFKIDIDEYDDQTYQDLKTFNLNGNHNDPSLSREYLSTKVMNDAGVACLRASPVQLYLNGTLRGIYTHAEQINKKFLESRFGETSGNLYKCSYPASLPWLGESQQAYKDVINPSPLNERAYELKTNEKKDDYADLVALCKLIHHTPDSLFAEAIDTLFDVNAYLKTLAIEVLIGHWDNYWHNKNNYYLYHHQASGKFIYLPYDMDNTWGVQWGVSNIDVRNVVNWGNLQNTSAPLTHKILAVPAYQKQYTRFLYELCQSVFTPTYINALADSMKNVLAPAVQVDPFFLNQVSTDYGYTVSDWNRSYTEAIDDHTTFGIKQYMLNRRNSALIQIPDFTGLNELSDDAVKLFPNPADGLIHIEAESETAYEIIDLNGKSVHKGVALSGKQAIDIQWPQGLYVVRLMQGVSVTTRKICIR